MLPVKEIQHTVDGPASSGDAVKPDNSPSLDSEPVQEDIQSKLRSIWAKVLHDDPANFTGDDVFFEVGGDSITAQHLIDAAAKDGIRLTMEQIFMHATLEDMAEIAQMTVPLPELPALEVDCNSADQDHLDTAASQLHLPAGSIEAAYDLTPMQESLLVEEEERPNSYTRQFVFRVRPNCDLDHLRHAWTETIRASPVLRTRFFHVEGQGKQQVVFRDDAEIVAWTTFHSSLAAFLKQDARSPMLVGDRFFRYSIIQDSEAGDTHFVWTVSHALCDGHSVVEILSDVARQFQGQEVPVRPPFHLFVQSSAVKPEPIHERHFWTRALSDVHPKPYPTLPQHLEFRPNPSATLEHCITLDQLPPFGVTKSLLLRTAWAILLSHYTGNEEVVFGVINNGRSSVVADVSLITGPTINLVPCALGVDPKQPVSVLLSRVRLQAAEMMPFEHSGLSRIRKFLSSGSSQHPTAIDLQSLLVVHHASFTDTIAPWMQKLGLQYRDNLGKKEQHSFPLVLTFVLSNKSTDATRILLRIEHDDRVISSPQVLHLAHHLQAILTQLSHATQDTLVESINPLHHLFERQARHSPDAIAVCSVERSLTYAEVNAYASALSMQLVELSVRPEVFVGVCFEKSIWTVVAILAVLKAGGAYVPIDPAHPPSRIQEIIQTVGIRVVLASPTGRNILERLIGPEELSIVQVRDGCTPRLYVEPPSVANPSNTAYLLFTSGSTGKPKGILMPHRAICTSILHHGPAFGAGPHWRTLQFCAHTFDLSVAEFFTTLSFGGCVCIPSEEDRTENLAGAITSLAANTLIVVPTVANLLFPEEVPTLKTLILSGEPIPKESITRWADHVDLTCAYGPSETAVWCSGNINVSSEANHADVGHSIGGTMWVVDADDHGTLAAVGCIGEIAISGAIVGSGYFGDQDTTDAAFVMAPEWIRNLTGDTMLYRSGDLGRYNPDGSFQVVGRRDTQVKLRGLRIELGEIENRLTQGGVVAAALAFLPPIGPAAGRIVAVVSQAKSNLHQDAAAAPTTQGRADIIAHRPRGSSDELVARLKQRLRSTLPDYMVPSIWIVLERMPLLISGKIDRKSLKIWVQEMSANIYNDVVGSEQDGADGAAVVPGSLADQLRQLWADVLPLSADDITLSTSFFAAGGDSIAAIQIVSQARRTLPDLRLSARAIINAKTLGNLATLLEDEEHQRREQQQQQKHNAPSVSLQNLTPGSGLGLLAPYQSLVASRLAAKPTTAKIQIQDAYALSPFQREVVRARDTNPAVLLMSWRMELWSLTHESLSLPRLVWAWRSVVARFPVLRSIFLKDAPKRLGLPVMQVLLSRNAAADASVLVSESSAGDPEPVFDDLVVPPVDDSFLPHRAHVIRHGERTYLQVEMDHLLIDGWSLGLIKKALLEAYETESTYSGVTSSYKAFIAAQTAPERVLADDEYWACRLHDLSPSLLSAALPEPDPASRQHKRIRKTLIPLPSISAASLIPYGAARGVTSASLFSAAWAQTLSHFTGRDDVAYEFIVSGRDEDIGGNSATSAWDLVGCCINVLVHRVQVDTDLAGLGSRIQEASDEGVRRQSSNIREVAQKATSAKLFDTAINFQRRAAAVENEMHTLRVDDDLKRSVDPWHFDVLVRVLEITDDNTFRLSLEFFGQDYSPEAMQKVGEHWWHIVRNVTI